MIALIAFSGNLVVAGEKLTEKLGLISLPPGFAIHIYAEGVIHMGLLLTLVLYLAIDLL